MNDKFAPENKSHVLDLVLPHGEDVGDKEPTEKEEGVNGEESLQNGLK